jgi:hypothetical protein
MKKRIIYPSVIALLVLIIHVLVRPYLQNQFDVGLLSLVEFRLNYLAVNQVVTVALAIILLIEGKGIVGVREVSLLLILNVFMDYNRIQLYPEIAIRANAVSMFAGIIIFGFGLVAVKSAIFKKGSGLIFILLGASYILRFPVFIDVLSFTVKKYYEPITAATRYFNGTLYINYIIIILGIIALDRILQDNASMTKFA